MNWKALKALNEDALPPFSPLPHHKDYHMFLKWTMCFYSINSINHLLTTKSNYMLDVLELWYVLDLHSSDTYLIKSIKGNTAKK